jgi:acyl carrier protein
VQRIIAHQIKSQPEKIAPHLHMQNDLGADSLDALEVINQVEEDFGINVPEEDARKMSTVQSIVDYLDKAIKTQQSTKN